MIYEQPNMTGGIDNTLIEIAHSVPAFPIGLLIFVYITVLLGGTAAQTRRTGSADYPLWALLASLSIFLLALIMTIKVGLIDLTVLGIIIAINILTGFWFFMSKGRNET